MQCLWQNLEGFWLAQNLGHTNCKDMADFRGALLAHHKKTRAGLMNHYWRVKEKHPRDGSYNHQWTYTKSGGADVVWSEPGPGLISLILPLLEDPWRTLLLGFARLITNLIQPEK